MEIKIGVITILKVNNYGAELQAYATQKIFELLGADSEIIDYLFYKNPGHKKTKASAPVFSHSFKKRVKEWLYPIICKLKSLGQTEAKQRRDARFEQFHAENTKLSDCYSSLDALTSAKLDYDILVSGSDQVWNPGNYTSLDPYFLNFGPVEAKRIAYASSFGVAEIPDYAVNYYKKSLVKYHAIGVRENTAVDLINSLTGQTAEWVLDPTLLLTHEQWMEVAKPVVNIPSTPYILIYELGNVSYIKQLALYLSGETGMPIVRICQNACREDVEKDIVNIIDAGPAEFLYLFDKAHVVVTNSFHGSAFSINFNKQFYTVVPKGKSNNSRQISLLKLFHYESCLIQENDDFPIFRDMSTMKKESRALLTVERNKSINFIKKTIYG